MMQSSVLTGKPRILLVGSGLTSAVASFLIQKEWKDAVEISVWDKARGIGGRMATSRSPLDSNCTADLGAQYISATPTYMAKHKAYYDELVANGLLEELNLDKVQGMRQDKPGTTHYVAPNGTSSLVKHFFEMSKQPVSFEHTLSSLNAVNNSWTAKTTQGQEREFDCVILTMPVPQIFQLQGDVHDIINTQPELKANLSSVTYSSRYGLALFYDKTATLPLQHAACYVPDHPVLRYVAVENVKRNRSHLPPAVVVHTTVEFGLEHVEKPLEEMKAQLLEAVQQYLPNLPKPADVKCQKWRYSQVTRSFPGSPGCVVLTSKPTLLAAGDGFTHSNFDGCVSSACSVLEHLRKISL